MTPRLTFGDPLPPADRNLCASLVRGRDATGALTPVRIQRQRTRGWRMPEGAVYVGRPTLFGNPWSVADARNHDIPEAERAAWCVRKYRAELDHLGLLGDWGGMVSEARWDEMAEAVDALPQEIGSQGIQSIRPLFRHLLRDATALACWCPLDQPCHADVLLELLTVPVEP